MAPSAGPARGPSRRAFLAGAAGVLGGLSAAGTGVGVVTATSRPTVLSWNVYLGVDLDGLFGATSLGEVRAIAGAMLAEVDPAAYEARAEAIAGTIEAAEPDVVALQEATLLRTQSPSDFESEDAGTAETVLVDFLGEIQSALDARGLGYDLADATVTTDVELPADTPDGPVDVRITDRDALLVRGEHDTGAAVTETYAAGIPFPVPGTTTVIQLRRGYCRVDVTVDGAPFVAVSTHLESVSADVRARQAGELRAALPDDRPVVLCGDVNSGPATGSGAYELLTETFDDAHVALEPGSEGATCCQPSDLTNEQSRLDRRFDLVMYRGRVRPVEVTRVGHRPADRVAVRRDDQEVRLWPSDHAGVAATLELPASTPTATPTPTSEPEPTPTGTSPSTPTPTAATGPCLGILAGVAGIAGSELSRLDRSVGGE
jgi:endonuclease/exonuclease/phosphatase family metal-dependent hydrolase